MKTHLRMSGSLLPQRRVDAALDSDSVRSALKRSGEAVRDEAEAVLDSQPITGRAPGLEAHALTVEIDPDAAKVRLVCRPTRGAGDNPGRPRPQSEARFVLASAVMVARDDVRALLRDGMIGALNTRKPRS